MSSAEIEFGQAAEAPEQSGLIRLWATPPRWVFHLVVAIPAIALLWSVTVPGYDFFTWLLSFYALAFGAVVWGLRMVTYVWARSRGRASGSAWWLLVAPLGGVLVLALVNWDVPVRARFAVTEGAFDRAAAAISAGAPIEDWRDRRIGSYEIGSIERTQGALVFYDTYGSFMDDAGFAYLPDGPDGIEGNGGWEAPQFRHLSGHWYAWTASW